MSCSSSGGGCHTSTPDASGEEDDSRERNNIRSGRRNIPCSASSTPRGTPDSLRSGPLTVLKDVLKKGDIQFADSDSSDSESSCGYPLLTALSRTPSIRSIPGTPLHHMIYMNFNPMRKPFFRPKFRPNSARSISSRPQSSSRSSTSVSDQKNRNGGQSGGDDADQALEMYSATRRPVSAPNGLQIWRNGSMRNKRSSPRVSFAPTKNDRFHSHVQTQTCNVQNGRTPRNKSTSLVTNSATQTLPDLSDYYSNSKENVIFPSPKSYQESKSSQTDPTFPRGREYNMDKYLDVTITAIAKREKYDKVRANSARGPRTQKSSERLSVKRCKSALAIMVTRKGAGDTCLMKRRPCNTSTRRVMSSDSESDQFDVDSVETSSNISDATSHFFGKASRRKARPQVPRRSYNLASYPRKPNQQGVKITPSKLAKLKKAYGKTNFDMSGLAFYTKKLRLPMHGGYKSVSSREVDGIVERLSACRLSCGRMHDYSTQDTAVPTRRKRRECHTAPSTRGSSRTNHDGGKSRMKKSNKQKPLSKSKLVKGERLNQDFGNVLTKSLDQIEDSLSRARYVLSNLSGYVSASPPECRRHRTTSLRSMNNGQLVGHPFIMRRPAGDAYGPKRDNLIERRIQEAWATNGTQSISPEWIHITKNSYSTNLFPDFPNPQFMPTKQRTLPYLRRNELLKSLKESGKLDMNLRAATCPHASVTKLPLLDAVPRDARHSASNEGVQSHQN